MIILDIETTGIIPWQNSIIDIGAIDLMNPKIRFSGQCMIWKGAKISERSLEINGYKIEQITPSNLESFPLKHNELINNFLDWTLNIENRTPCSQNQRFDISFLMEASRISNNKWTLGYRSIDLHTTAYNWLIRDKKEIKLSSELKISTLSLDTILEILNLPKEAKPHKAINGALLVAEAYSRLIYGKNLLEKFKKCPIPESLKQEK